jgi:queuosine precursor transporter
MKDARAGLYVILCCTFVVALVVGDLIGGKLAETVVFGQPFTISMGMIPFPVTFLLTDLVNEFYGPKAARFMTLTGFGVAVFAFITITIAAAIPIADFTRAADWSGVRTEAFDNVLASSQRILVASLVAYLVAQFTDMSVFHLLKRVSNNRFLWLRATGSTMASQLIDTMVIQTLAWWGILPFSKIIGIAVSSYVVKLAVAIGLTPAVYAGHAVVERWLGLKPVVLDAQGGMVEG